MSLAFPFLSQSAVPFSVPEGSGPRSWKKLISGGDGFSLNENCFVLAYLNLPLSVLNGTVCA